MPMRRTRLPPLAVLIALMAGAILISAAWPEKQATGCCAVKSMVQMGDGAKWRVEVMSSKAARNGSSITHHIADLPKSIRTCCAAGYCSPIAVPCVTKTRTIEDPSDALWLRAYNEGGEMVVLVRGGILTLIIMVGAILVDGAMARPRRERIAYAPLAALVLLSLSALLQLCLIPRRYQPSLLGSGIVQTIIWIVMILVGAFVLPGIALTIQTISLLVAQFVFLTARSMFWGFLGCANFLFLITRFYIRNLILQIQVFYSSKNVHNDIDYAQDVYMEQLNISYEFVGGISYNALLRKIPAGINDSARLVLKATMGIGNSVREFADLDDTDDEEDVDDEIVPNFSAGLVLRMPPGNSNSIPQRNDGFLDRRGRRDDDINLYGAVDP